MNEQSTSAWQSLLANLGPTEHAVQIYQDDNFFSQAVSHFTIHGLMLRTPLLILKSPFPDLVPQ
jgi:hypothetical protein